jgi:hypothetical protein
LNITPLDRVGVAIGGSRQVAVEVAMDLCWKIAALRRAAPRGDENHRTEGATPCARC